jgi:hypothetical protein
MAYLSRGHATGLLPRPHTAGRKGAFGTRCMIIYLGASRHLILVLTVDERSLNGMRAAMRAEVAAESAPEEVVYQDKSA